jgi:predicted Zn-dependent peptidase
MTVELHRLPNGFRIVVEPVPGLQSASLGIWVTAGGRHERADQNGIAHFLEHMAFKGTATAQRACRSPRRSRMWAAISTPIPRAR